MAGVHAPPGGAVQPVVIAVFRGSQTGPFHGLDLGDVPERVVLVALLLGGAAGRAFGESELGLIP